MKPADSAWSATEACSRRLLALHVVLGGVALGLIAVLLWVIDTPEGDVPVQPIDHALRCIEAPTATAFNRHGLAELLNRPGEPADSCWRPVSLPSVHPAQALAFSTRTPLMSRVWYRLDYRVPDRGRPPQRLMVLLPRAMAWAWQLRVDGRMLDDGLDDWRMTWNQPIVVRIPTAVAQPGRSLRIELLQAEATAMGHAVPRIWIGPSSEVAHVATWRHYLQISMPQACIGVLLLLGGFFFVFWLARRQESTHLLLALACIAWSVCNLQYTLPRHDDPVLAVWYDTIVNLAIVWVMWLIYQIVLRFDSRRVRWVEWALPGYVLVTAILSLPLWHWGADLGLPFQLLNTLVAAAITLRIVALAANGTTEIRVIAIALVIAMLAGAHDVALIGMAINPEDIFLLPYSSLLVFSAFLFAMQRRYARAIGVQESLAQTLSSQLAEREAELNANHARLLAFEREQALQQERQRLMYDMHDGVGAALLTTLAAVEEGRIAQGAVAQALRTCLEHLRLVIDSLEPMEHNLLTLLATLRYRLGPQLEAAGLKLVWDIEDLPPLAWLEAPGVLNLFRLIQEALANVLKHANADTLRIATRNLGETVEVEIQDDGRGFNPDAIRAGRGLRSMRNRAHQLRGELAIHTQQDQGTRLVLRLPV